MSARSLAAAVPTWLALGAIMGVSFVVRLVYALRDPAPWIFHDEIAYSELAKSFAENGAFAMREVAGTGGFGVVYPILISPAFALFDSVNDAYDALRVINCLLVSLTAVPVYLIGRRIAGRWLALAAAALSLAIPTLMYTSTVMTENAFYPIMALFGLALIRAFERPTFWRQAVVFVLLGLAFFTRAQAIILVPVIGTALLAVVLLDVLAARGAVRERVQRAVVPYWPTLAAMAVGAVVIPVRQLIRDEPLSAILGTYGGVTALGYNASAVGEYLVYHLADLVILLGAIPVAAFIAFMLWSLRPLQPRELRIFSAVGASMVAWFVIVAAAYGSTPVATRIVERNMFHVAPFFFLALVGWIHHGLPRPWWAAAPAALFTATLTLGLPLNTFLNGTVVHSTPGLIPIWRWRDRLFSIESIDEVVFLAAAAGAVVFLFIPRRWGPLLLLVLMAYFVAAARPVEGLTHGASVGSYSFGVGSPPSDWIDRRVDGDVASFWWTGSSGVPFWNAEFFNRNLKRAYSLSGAYDGLVHTFTYLSLRPSGLFVDGDGNPIRERYVMTDRGSRLRGTIVARKPRADLVVYELDGPLTGVERIDGLFFDDWSGPSFTFRRYDCRGGSLRLAIENDPRLRSGAFSVPVTGGTDVRELRFNPRELRRTETISLRPVNRVCEVTLSIPAASAPRARAGDERELGLRFRDIRFQPAANA